MTLVVASVIAGPEFAGGKVPSSGRQAAAGSAQMGGPAGGDRQGQPTVSERQQPYCKTVARTLIRACFSASVSEFSAVDPKASPELCTDCVTQPGPPAQPSSSTRSLSADGVIFFFFCHFCFPFLFWTCLALIQPVGFSNPRPVDSWSSRRLTNNKHTSCCAVLVFTRLVWGCKQCCHDAAIRFFIPLWLKAERSSETDGLTFPQHLWR